MPPDSAVLNHLLTSSGTFGSRLESWFEAKEQLQGCLGVEDRKVKAIKDILMECFFHLRSWRCILQPCETLSPSHQQHICMLRCMDGAFTTPDKEHEKHLHMMLCMISDKSSPSFKVCLKIPTQYFP